MADLATNIEETLDPILDAEMLGNSPRRDAMMDFCVLKTRHEEKMLSSSALDIARQKYGEQGPGAPTGS